MDGLRIDSHKLMFHPDRVSDWARGKDIFPIFLDVSPTSACNHSCIFCGLDYAHNNKAVLSGKVMGDLITDCAGHGVRSIMYAGEGEPLINKSLAEIIVLTKKKGIDAALNTNGVLMGKNFLKKTLGSLTWVRVSIDAGCEKTYMKIHGAREGDFARVLDNLKSAVSIKKKMRYDVTIGTQLLLLKENAADALLLAKRLKSIGVDYLIVKPYSKHPLSKNDAGTEIDYTKMAGLEKRLLRYADKDFAVFFRKDTMKKRFKEKPYMRCFGAPFWAYISADGEVYPCHTYLGIKKYSFGNLNKESFYKLWKGNRRKKVMAYFYNKMDARNCRELCRLDEINKYLWQLKNPHPHVNFI